MQNYQMQHLHSREAERDIGHMRITVYRLVSNPLLEQTLLPYKVDFWAHNLCFTVEW